MTFNSNVIVGVRKRERDRPYTLTGGYMNFRALETWAIHESIALFTYSEERDSE